MLPLSPVLKTNGDYYRIFQEVLTEARYRMVVENLVSKAEAGDLRSQRLIIEHAQGKPTQRIEVTSREDGNLAKIQALLEAAGQPVTWTVGELVESTVSEAATQDNVCVEDERINDAATLLDVD